jgi:AmmeMemoRadiSam system protein B
MLASWYITPHPPLAVPSVGRGQEQGIASTIAAFEEIGRDFAQKRIDTVMVISPHAPVLRDAIAILDVPEMEGSMRNFRAPQEKLSFTVDTELIGQIFTSQDSNFLRLDKETARGFHNTELEIDHGAFVPLYYLTRYCEKKPELVLGAYGFLPPQELYNAGIALGKVFDASEKRIAFVASGDLSHHLTHDGPYPYHPDGAVFDREIVEIIKSGEPDRFLSMDEGLVERAGQCGWRSFCMLAGVLHECEMREGRVLSYEGPFGVGYCVSCNCA